MSSHEAINMMAENSLKRKVVSTKEPERETNGEPVSKAMRPDDGSALSPSSIAAMAYNAVRAVRTYAVRTFNAYAVRTDIPHLRQEEAQRGVPTTESAAVGHAESKTMQADVAEQSGHSTSIAPKQIEVGPSASTSGDVRRQPESDAVVNRASVQDSHLIAVKQEQIEPGPSTLASGEVRQQPKTNPAVNGASVHDCPLITVKHEQIEPGPSTSASAAVLLAGGESAGDVKLKKIAKVELQRGYTSWYTEISPAYLKVTEESGEIREVFHFAQLVGCLVDEMVFECRDKTTDNLVRLGHSWVHFESGIKRLQNLAEGLRSLQLIVWEGMTDKHLFKLPCFVSRKFEFEYPDDLDDVEMTSENFTEILRRSGEPPVRVEKYFTLPAPLHINIDSFGGDLYERMMLSLIESLHKVHKNDGNIVTLVRAVRPWYSKRGFWMSFATSLFKFVRVTANPASRLPEYAERCAWINNPMSDVKDITFRLELDYRDGARDEFEKFAKSQAVDVKPSDGDSLEFTAKYGSYMIRCALTLEPSITVNVDGHDEVQENSLVSISIVKRV